MPTSSINKDLAANNQNTLKKDSLKKNLNLKLIEDFNLALGKLISLEISLIDKYGVNKAVVAANNNLINKLTEALSTYEKNGDYSEFKNLCFDAIDEHVKTQFNTHRDNRFIQFFADIIYAVNTLFNSLFTSNRQKHVDMASFFHSTSRPTNSATVLYTFTQDITNAFRYLDSSKVNSYDTKHIDNAVDIEEQQKGLRFSENDHLEKVVRGYRGYSAKELDQYFDALEQDPEAMSSAQKALNQPIQYNRSIWNESPSSLFWLDEIAKKHGIDYGHHSGGSFQTLKNDILYILKRGGRTQIIEEALKSNFEQAENSSNGQCSI